VRRCAVAADRGFIRRHLHSHEIFSQLAKPDLRLRNAASRFNTWSLRFGHGRRRRRLGATDALFD
jgi:hypothetical protein